MNLPRYEYFSNDYQEYQFYSDGPKGRIKKVVTFFKIQDDPVIYNLAFGEEDPQTGAVSDTIVTNNNDRTIVLATVANTINDFCDHFGNHIIYAEGSTPARTRLYQMGISGLLDELGEDFDVYGARNGEVLKFQRDINYEAFLSRENKRVYLVNKEL